jgi:hypothetical protein
LTFFFGSGGWKETEEERKLMRIRVIMTVITIKIITIIIIMRIQTMI